MMQKHIDYYSEPIQEIMGGIPSWITRWGVTVLFTVIAIIVAGSCIVSYPDIITAPVTILGKEGQVSARMTVSSAGIGQIEIGQAVLVSLDCYPYLEYGVIQARVRLIVSEPEHSNTGQLFYPVELDFPNGLESNYGVLLRSFDEMSGIAKIVTRDKKLIEHFIAPVRHINNKRSDNG